MFQLWGRLSRFRNIYASLGIDLAFTIFWVSAFASVQVWTNSGVPDSSQGYCANFAYGDQDKCVVSYGTVVIGVLLFLCWFGTSGISVYNFLRLRSNGPSRPSISNPRPIEPKFVYPDNGSSVYSENSNAPPPPASRIHDLEKGPAFLSTQTQDNAHPGRKLSWGQSPPNTAPVRPNYPEARPVFRQVDYSRGATETSPLSSEAPKLQQRRGAQSARYVPPRLQLVGPQDRSPALVVDYGTMAQTPLTPNINAKPYNLRGGQMMRAPSTAYGSMYGGNFMNGYRSYYGGNAAEEDVPPVPALQPRKPVDRLPMPGPASYRAGGYSSGFNTPLPTSMLTPQAQGNSWRQDVDRSYQQQLDQSALNSSKGTYAL